jgi:HPt (histidine-containing phosphotransfer) domain-containing protein
MGEDAIDRPTYAELEATAGVEFVVELVDTFLVEAPAMLAELEAALATGDADAFRRTAHSLKSNGNTFGALRLATLAKQLELGGIGPVLEAKGAPLETLAEEYARVAGALAELKHG